MFLIYVTVSNVEEARSMAYALLSEQICACANVIPGVTSLYRWEGKIEESQEAVVILKTHDNLVTTLMTRIRELHSYECPCITALKIDAADNNFIKWLESSVKLA